MISSVDDYIRGCLIWCNLGPFKFLGPHINYSGRAFYTKPFYTTLLGGVVRTQVAASVASLKNPTLTPHFFLLAPCFFL